MLLDKRHRLIEFVELFRGTIDGASVHPREVVNWLSRRTLRRCSVRIRIPRESRNPAKLTN
jgi:DNA repair protein RadC